MDPRHRDGLLAVAGLGALLAGTLATVGVRPLLDPRGVVAGVAGALVLETAFLRYPDLVGAAWERRGVPLAGLLVVLALGAAALRVGPVLLGALAWGLTTYLALLGSVLAGLGNPMTVVAGRGRE